ncbi:hypothetical protein G7Z17_g7815 [Cylindrodendrum hubeiense]|uniref:Protection of telomeres protein 1 ssDNA-binding domain-containing protein n=1 Tax=Cylindrodendrum hubeiense TaxID=595255 RepID=A0A9P5H9T8_9HYPO|nr:hypothetical protein G7Z17_g7815 [Cylindrodendrum hubeiense]
MAAATAPPLPSGFVNAQDILDGKIPVRFYDLSVEDDNDSSLSLNVFRPEKEMPTAGCGDVILLLSVKVQRFGHEAPSLITHRETKVHIYSAAKIPKPPVSAMCALRPSPRPQDRPPAQKENAYVAYMFHKIGKGRVPTESEFELMTMRSANVKEKFSLLKNVQDGRFCDIVVQVAKEPYDQGDKVTLWVSDYTENMAFFHYAFDSTSLAEEPDGDPYSYTTKYSRAAASKADWNGPFGKRSMQITCFEPHATAIREGRISFGTWVSIRNLQIKFGHNASNLEGYLREDRAAHGPKLGISPLDPRDDPENINPHLKEALRRKRDYERTKKEQLQDISEAAKAGQKRKAEVAISSELKKLPASKARRRALRAQAQEAEQKVIQPIPAADVNSQVKCENQNKPASFVADMLVPVTHETIIDGQPVKLQLPFMNTNYRTNVRVVNFMPAKLEDFAFAKKASEFDVLSDNEDSDGGSESEQDTMTAFTANRNWEWRFYLELEDAAVLKNQQKRRIWVAVDNQAAQCLMNLDASNLRHDAANLEALRRCLALLWGDLEEHKSRIQAKKARSIKAAREGQPPADSSDEDEPNTEAEAKTQVMNLPFTCCIRQYGVKVRESDTAKADAGEGSRWQRMFGLFGTRISIK